MVKFRRGLLKGLYLKADPPSKKGGAGYTLSNIPYTAEHPSLPQAKARATLASWMISNTRGMTGTEDWDGRRIPITAYYAATRYPYKNEIDSEGRVIKTAFGGLTPVERAERRYARADAKISKLLERVSRLSATAGIRAPATTATAESAARYRTAETRERYY